MHVSEKSVFPVLYIIAIGVVGVATGLDGLANSFHSNNLLNAPLGASIMMI